MDLELMTFPTTHHSESSCLLLRLLYICPWASPCPSVRVVSSQGGPFKLCIRSRHSSAQSPPVLPSPFPLQEKAEVLPGACEASGTRPLPIEPCSSLPPSASALAQGHIRSSLPLPELLPAPGTLQRHLPAPSLTFFSAVFQCHSLSLPS